MSFLYCTADRVGIQTGGGLVTNQEMTALMELAAEKDDVEHVLSRDSLTVTAKANNWNDIGDPWRWDSWAVELLTKYEGNNLSPKLAQFYAGTFTDTVKELQKRKCKVAYTAAAHDVKVSREEHEKLGFAYDYPHLTNENLFRRYVGGYLNADVLICPSTHSKKVMQGFGAKNRIEVIPHGCEISEKVAPLPNRLTVGCLGSVGGPDKGILYLLQAWKMLNRKDATLILAGRDSTSAFVTQLIQATEAGNVIQAGWQDDVVDFYASVSLYVQPSASEGFGIEVLESMANGRAVICSDGAGAADVVPDGWVVPARNYVALADKINTALNAPYLAEAGQIARKKAASYTWDKVHAKYREVWKSLL